MIRTNLFSKTHYRQNGQSEENMSGEDREEGESQKKVGADKKTRTLLIGKMNELKGSQA